MRSTATVFLAVQALLFASSSVAEELRAGDVPAACTAICGPIVELTNTCDIDPEEGDDNETETETEDDTEPEGAIDDEAIEAECICTNNSFDVASIMALCASCISQESTTPVDDVDKIMSQCGFASMSYAPSATAIVAGVSVQATRPATTAVAAATTGATAATASASASASSSGNSSAATLAGLSWSVLLLGGLASACLWL